jgi:hypothetical protein
MKDCSDSPGCYRTVWRLTSLPGRAKELSKLVVNRQHSSPQVVRVPSGRFMSHDRATLTRATGK